MRLGTIGYGIAWMLFAFSLRGGVLAAECLPVDGAPFEANLAAVDAEWRIRLDSNGKSRTLPANDVVSWGALVDPARPTWLVLADGGLLVADLKEGNREKITVSAPLFGELQIPLELLAGLVVQAPTGVDASDRLVARIRSAQSGTDQLILENGDQLGGTLQGLTISADGDGKFKLEAEVGLVDVDSNRVMAAIFKPAGRASFAATGMQAWVGLSDGSALRATSLVLSEKSGGRGTAWLTLPGNLTWQTSAVDVVFLQPLGTRARYLSELEPIGYRQIPFLDTPGVAWELGRDASVSGRQLRAGGRRYLKGLGMHSAGRVTYAIEPDDRRFEATLAVDAEAGNQGSVVFRVYVDNEQRYASPVLRGGDAPLPISVDVRGGAKLNLIVDFADRGDQLDRADWLHARLVR